MKSYRIIEDEELIELTEDDDVLTAHMVIVDLLKKDHKRKLNDSKDEDVHIDYRFILGSAVCADRLFSHCKYFKTETRNRLTTTHFEVITFLKSNREILENSQQFVSRAISMSKKNSLRI